jgi:hypothetical protein
MPLEMAARAPLPVPACVSSLLWLPCNTLRALRGIIYYGYFNQTGLVLVHNIF